MESADWTYASLYNRQPGVRTYHIISFKVDYLDDKDTEHTFLAGWNSMLMK